MFKASKTMILKFASTMLMFVAATGIDAACWLYWYQPKMLTIVYNHHIWSGMQFPES